VSVTAYFIGGPEDRTVRELPSAVPAYEVMVQPRAIYGLGIGRPDEHLQAGMVAQYRRIGETYYKRGTFIYEFAGYR